ncbi:hypothetical protein HDU97_008887, partial [Phlyctochytrium planicorne]
EGCTDKARKCASLMRNEHIVKWLKQSRSEEVMESNDDDEDNGSVANWSYWSDWSGWGLGDSDGYDDGEWPFVGFQGGIDMAAEEFEGEILENAVEDAAEEG